MTLPYARWSFDRALEGVAKAGFRHVGLLQAHGDGPILPERPTSQNLTDLRRRVESHGLTPALKFAQRTVGDPAEALRTDVDTIAELGIPYLLHIPISPGPKFASERIGEMA